MGVQITDFSQSEFADVDPNDTTDRNCFTDAEMVEHYCEGARTFEQAVWLWNWVDYKNNPEPLWDIMRAELPWAFRDPQDANSIRFEAMGPRPRLVAKVTPNKTELRLLVEAAVVEKAAPEIVGHA